MKLGTWKEMGKWKIKKIINKHWKLKRIQSARRKENLMKTSDGLFSIQVVIPIHVKG